MRFGKLVLANLGCCLSVLQLLFVNYVLYVCVCAVVHVPSVVVVGRLFLFVVAVAVVACLLFVLVVSCLFHVCHLLCVVCW